MSGDADWLAAVREAARSPHGKRPSGLRRMMEARYEALRPVLEGEPNWAALAARWAEEGWLDANGRPATATLARQTWWKVRRAAERRMRHGTAPAGPVRQAVVPERPGPPASGPPAPRRFRTAAAKDWSGGGTGDDGQA